MPKVLLLCENIFMRYVSTRSSSAQSRSFSDILLEGLAPDGGLYVPEEYPQLTDTVLTELRTVFAERGYPGLAARIMGMFIDDIPLADIEAMAERAYTAEKFQAQATPAMSPDRTPSGALVVTPVTPIGSTGLWIGHTSNGPTAAFKDMAMQLLGELFEYELARRGQTLTILGATSGDTGSAAEYALRSRKGVSVVMLTPAGRMTPFQRAQMFGLRDPNIINVAVDGVFDDCQELVKAVNADAEFKSAYHIGAVNSINWARLMAQIVYYVALWIQIAQSNDEKVSFAVPSGNFGNICAGHIARQMGLPIAKLIVATNENDVLDQFFRTGVYRVRAGCDVAKTSSPSMDIAKASNFERFIFDLLGRDGERVRALFGEAVNERGEFSLAGTAEFESIAQNYGFLSGSSTHSDRLAEIKRLWEDYGILIDPHTADGMHVASYYALNAGDGDQAAAPIVVVETALPVKFAETIKEAIGESKPAPERFAGVENAQARVIDLPNNVQAVKDLIRELSFAPSGS